MLYGGPLGTYLSGLSSSGTNSHSNVLSSSNTYNNSGTSSSNYYGSGIRRSNSRYRSSGLATGSTLSPSTSSSTTPTPLSNYYTPQLRRKYGTTETETPKSSLRYSHRTQPRTSPSPSTTSTNVSSSNSPGTHSGLFHYSRWSPNKTSSPTFYGSSSIGTSSSWNAELNTASSGSTTNVDYKRLYEAEKLATEELRTEIAAAQKEGKHLQERIDAHKKSKSTGTAQQRRIERRISECEEELKTLEKLRAESEKLRAEHRALVRVVARLNREK